MSKLWTEDDLAKLVELKQNNTSYSEIAKLLNRTKKSVINKISSLGLGKKLNYWTEDEDSILIKHLDDNLSHSEIATILGRTKSSVSSRVSHLGLCNDTYKKWSEEEDSLLVDLRIDGKTYKEIAEILNRTEKSIEYRSTKLGILTKVNYWTNKEDTYLINNYNTSTLHDLSKSLNRSIQSIRSRADKLQIRNSNNLWSEHEDNYLIDNYKNSSVEELSNILNRSISSIKNRVHILGIRKGKFKSHEQFVEELTNKFPHLEPIGQYTHSKVGLLIRNNICNHEYEIVPNWILTNKISGNCLICNPKSISSGEIQLREYLNSIGIEFIHNDRKILKGKELDIFIPDNLLGIEYNGEFWHSDYYSRDYSLLNKTLMANNECIDLIHIWEHEWKIKNDIVKSRISGILGCNRRIFARKTNLQVVDWSNTKEFLDRCHIQGSGSPTKINIGLFIENLLVAVMTFNTPRFNKNYQFELVRYCSDLNTNVIGGASKLLKYFIKEYNPKSIISYSDRRWGRGILYKKLGFSLYNVTDPSYFYIKGSSILSRYDAQKHKLSRLIPNFYDPNKTEEDMMEEAGYVRCYDCGNYVWSLIV